MEFRNYSLLLIVIICHLKTSISSGAQLNPTQTTDYATNTTTRARSAWIGGEPVGLFNDFINYNNNHEMQQKHRQQQQLDGFDQDQQQQQHARQPIKSIAEGTIRVLLTRNITTDPYHQQVPLISYYGAIGVGTANPTQLFNVVFDTGSAESWVPYYTGSWFANNLHYTNGFYCSGSPTCRDQQKKICFNQWQTEIQGRVMQDTLTLYEMMEKDLIPHSLRDRLELPGSTFVQAEDASGDTDDVAEQFRYTPYDGVVGLKPSPYSPSGVKNIIYSLRQNLPDYDQYIGFPYAIGFWFNPDQQSRYGAELTLGGYDRARVGGGNRFHFHRTRNGYEDWSLALNGVSFGSQRLGCLEGNCFARFETGTNSIVGPREEVEQIYSLLGTQFDTKTKIAQVNCADVPAMPQLTILLDNTPYVLYSDHYVKRFLYKNTQVCYLAIKPWDKKNTWIMGVTFIGSYYTMFDFKDQQIGFATASS